VPEDVREQIHRLLRAKLKAGGLVMISYNAMPGWAALQPIRQMMHSFAQTLEGDSIAKARSAYAYAQLLAKNGAAYFANTPAAATHLQEIAAHDIRYVAHEYITAHAEPFYVAQVAQAMHGVGLSLAGSMTPSENYVEWSVPAPFHALLSSAPDRVQRETHFDFIANTRFRRDLFVAQPALSSAGSVPLSAFDTIQFSLADLPERLSGRQAPAPLKRFLQEHERATEMVYALLAEGPQDAHALHRAMAVNSETLTSLLLQGLVAARHVAPCSPQRVAPGWMRANTALIDAAIRDHHPRVPLACAATGAASYCDVVYAAAIEAAVQFSESRPAANAVLARLRQHNYPVNKRTPSGDKRPASDDEVLQYAGATCETLHDPGHADARLLRLLGIIGQSAPFKAS
jgi:hypothetical protein